MSYKYIMVKKVSNNSDTIVQYIKLHPKCTSTEILVNIGSGISIATLKRALKELISNGLVSSTGKLKGTKYEISNVYEIIKPIEIDQYFSKEVDERVIQKKFNNHLLRDTLLHTSIFTNRELSILNDLQEIFKTNCTTLSANEFNKEFERLAIDLSWKSSQIEGNTYSLLETERLLKDKETAAGKTKDEASMLLNHKVALDFIIENPNYIYPLTVARIEDIHSLLIKDLGISRNIRNRRVGISGTNYTPLDNEFQIKEALENMCNLINEKEIVFEKALLALVLISYIQPFTDGNKRTARIISNAILINNHFCPISFRTIDAVEYKKALLVFYEQANIYPFKKVFINQFEFAVKTYF